MTFSFSVIQEILQSSAHVWGKDLTYEVQAVILKWEESLMVQIAGIY